jgi:hypothetical protein
MLAEARAEVSIADQKAGLVLAAAGIGFSAVLGGLLAGDWRPSKYNLGGEILWWFGAVLAFATVASAATAMWPRFTTRSEDDLVSYWGHVARFATLDALESALDAQPTVDRDRTRHQLWRLARIVRIKYWCIRWALVSGGAAAAVFVLAGLFG